MLPVMYIVLGLGMSIYKKDAFPLIVFTVMSAAWYFLYPLRDRKRYVTHYTNYVNENAKNRVGRRYEMTFEADAIRQSGEAGETRINMSEILEIYELKTILLIRLKSGSAFVIPKAGIEELTALKEHLREIAVKMDVPFTVKDQWEWK